MDAPGEIISPLAFSRLAAPPANGSKEAYAVYETKYSQTMSKSIKLVQNTQNQNGKFVNIID